VFVARVAFVTAEAHVDYEQILNHILTRRGTVERAAGPVARRLGYAVVEIPVRPSGLLDDLVGKLEQALTRTATFGYRQARTEILSLRAAAPIRPVLSAYQIPDAGRHGVIARGGLDAIRTHIRRRAHDTAAAIYDAAQTAAADTTGSNAVKVAAAASAATRILHNQVLELVGETLNLGRTAGVFSLPVPPEFAMRSEQLDANTCERCDELHGTIVEIGTAEYWDLTPPAECLGGGRCRGIWVYGDSADEVEQQQAA
jgi:hypothetical protein